MAPFWQLCDNGDLEAVRAAIARGEDVNAGDDQSVTGLMWALVMEHNSVVKVLLQQPSLDINSIASNGNTAIHWSCSCGNMTGLRMLLGDPRLSSVNTGCKSGFTPLMVAVLKGKVEFVRELMRVEGVDLETRDGEGRSPEELARWVKCSAILGTN